MCFRIEKCTKQRRGSGFICKGFGCVSRVSARCFGGFRMLQVRGVKGQRLGCQCLCELEWVLKDVVEGGALNAGLALILAQS